MRWLALVMVALALSPATLAPAGARPEAEAPSLRDDVVAVFHEPATPLPGQQFTGRIVLADNTTVTRVQYQVCIIDLIVCIIPPRDAGSVLSHPGITWVFDTAEFIPLGSDKPYPWPAGSRIGVQWFLDGEPFPDGPALSDPSCEGREEECYAAHYFEFRMADAREAPLPLLALAAIALAAWRRRG